jgi:hypothetical protein
MEHWKEVMANRILEKKKWCKDKKDDKCSKDECLETFTYDDLHKSHLSD